MAGETLLGGDAPVETVADPAVVAPATAEAAPAETKPTDKPVGAPEKYEDFKAPEGIELDKTQVEAFVPLAKELGLTQEAAQKLVDFYASNQAAAARAQETAWNATVDGWIAAAKSDKEIGGAALGENLAVAKKALDMFGTPISLSDLAAARAQETAWNATVDGWIAAA